jgi:phosphate transport system substrate-binding protein
MKTPLYLASALLLALPFSACKRSDRPSINNGGSDTMLEVAMAWQQAYAAVNRDVQVRVSGGGSGVGLASLIDGKVDLANSSRPMKKEELERARKAGENPREYPVGFDAIAIYVHRDNPIASITLEQLAAIYGHARKVNHWSELGVTVPGSKQPRDKGDEILVISRQNNSGTYEYFREAVLHNHDFRLGTQDLNGSNDVVETVARTPRAIGYCGLAYATDQVKLVPVARDAESKAVAPSVDSVLDKSYPISRPLFMYTADTPKPHVQAYLDWILSDDGQRVLMRAGYPPLRRLQ